MTHARSRDSTAPPRDRILDAADRLFSIGGVRGTGVNSIIATADVAKATFYRHFPSKDDLVVAWLASRAPRRLEDILRISEERAATPGERLAALVDALVDHAVRGSSGGFPYLETAMEVRAPSPQVGRVLGAYFEEVRGVLADLADAAGSPTPDVAAAQLQLILFGVIASARALPAEAADLADVARGAARSIVSDAG